MSDLGEMLREALLDAAPARPEQGEDVLEAAVESFAARMRTVRFMGMLMVFGPTVFVAAGLWFFLSEPDGSGRVLGALLGLFGLAAIGMGKMWFHAMVSHVQVMRELKLTRLAIARLADDLHSEKPPKD